MSEHTRAGIVPALSTTEELLLHTMRHKERYGLEILHAVTAVSAGQRRIGFGSLYPALKRMEKRGWVTAFWGNERERNGGRRRYYRITPKGKHVLQETELLRTRAAAWEAA